MCTLYMIFEQNKYNNHLSFTEITSKRAQTPALCLTDRSDFKAVVKQLLKGARLAFIGILM